MNSTQALHLIRSLGPSWLAWRVWFAVEKRTGLLRRRTPPVRLDDLFPDPQHADSFAADWLEHAPRLPVAALDPALTAGLIRQWDAETGGQLHTNAASIGQGRLRLFSGHPRGVGFPPNWHQNPLTGQRTPPDHHWSSLGDFGFGDIKGVWEPSRFAWAFTLVRAWLADRNPAHAETFWLLVEDWARRNPPNLGANWKCGQEAAIRLFALSFSIQAFSRVSPTTPARLALAARLAHATALRIDAHLAYALSQSNNHGISEAAGLITAGALWPMLPYAERWLARGLRCLEAQVSELVYQDGGFSQHSTNYHRVLLHDLLWCDAVLRAAGRALPASVIARAAHATRFLHALMEHDGRVHRYGADDGADLLPLSSCAYADFRPVVGAGLAAFCNERLPPGPWDETAFLVSGQSPRVRDQQAAPDSREPAVAETTSDATSDFPDAGIRLLRSGRMSAMLRLPTRFRHRPSHADQLHVDVWMDHRPIAEDPGTFSYNAPGPLGAGMGEARFHNTVTVGGAEPMDRVSRFLWLPWTPCHRWPDQENLVQAWHDGYRRLPSRFRHARALLTVPDGLVVVDRLTGAADEEVVLRWHGQARASLATLAVSCSTTCNDEWISADEYTGEGWYCAHYAERTPAWCHRISACGRLVFFATAIGTTVKWTDTGLLVGERVRPLSPDPNLPVFPPGPSRPAVARHSPGRR